MNNRRPAQQRVLFATLTECQSAAGNIYMRGWAGASNLVAFRGEPDEQGRPTWQLFLTERPPRPGPPAGARAPQRSGELSMPGEAPEAPGARSVPRATAAAARHNLAHDAPDFDAPIPF